MKTSIPPDQEPGAVVILDYGLGNLYSIKQACSQVGLNARITSARQDILQADAVILPGVGAFGDAMTNLRKLDLISVLQDVAASGKILMGICLGMQLLMSESLEFGHHRGLGLVPGQVVPFDNPREGEQQLKVPQIGWNRIQKTIVRDDIANDSWITTLLEGIEDGEYMYFVHSFIVQPTDSRVVLSASTYGHIRFCSSLNDRNIFACQFHPERSGLPGLTVYRNLAKRLRLTQGEQC